MVTSSKEHILLTSLGMRAIETEYEWNVIRELQQTLRHSL